MTERKIEGKTFHTDEDFRSYVKAERTRASIISRTAKDPKERKAMRRREKVFSKIENYYNDMDRSKHPARNVEVR